MFLDGFLGGKAEFYDDYRKLLDRKDIDCVTISTPDHWHTRIAVAALRAGKDIYCQKPMTLTIDEGKLICKVAKETGRVFQVGTQQRSERLLRRSRNRRCRGHRPLLPRAAPRRAAGGTLGAPTGTG